MAEWKINTARSSADAMSHIQSVQAASSSLVASSEDEASKATREHPCFKSVPDLNSDADRLGGATLWVARRKLQVGWPSADDPNCSCHT